MNKILNPNYGITDATNIDMFKGDDMVEIVTDGYGKIYAYPEDIRKIAPFFSLNSSIFLASSKPIIPPLFLYSLNSFSKSGKAT